MATKVNENTEVALPLRNIISMIAAANCNMGILWYLERLNQIETNQTMMQADLEFNTEFRVNGSWRNGFITCRQ